MKVLKVIALAACAVTLSSQVLAADRVEYRGRIIQASKCSQNKDASYFSTSAQRALKCSKIRLPGNDVCDAIVTDSQRPSKMVLEVPGLGDHKATKRGSITFNKGGVIVYESSKRTGAFHNKPGFFSSQKTGDQLEFMLTSRGGSFELNKVALYLDHSVSGSRMTWTEYTCSF